jgi:D-alanyl-D-alanine carboxypeptidase
MADRPLPQQLHAIGVAAAAEAVRRRARAVDAEHVLLAIAAGASPVASTLSAAGLDHDALDVALSTERAHSLRRAGVEPFAPDKLAATPWPSRPDWGTSVRELIHNAERPTTRASGALETELAVGILSLKVGTVPRALAIAGVDRTRLLSELRR